MDVKSEALLRCFRSLKAVPVPALFGSRTALSGLSGRQLPPVSFPLVLVWGMLVVAYGRKWHQNKANH